MATVPDSPPKRMTRARAKAQETAGKLTSKPLKMATPAPKTTRTTTKRKLATDDVTVAKDESLQAKRPRGRPRKNANTDENNQEHSGPVGAAQEATSKAPADAPRALRNRPRKMEVEKNLSSEAPTESVPARRTTRAQAAAPPNDPPAGPARPIRAKAPIRKRVRFQEQDLDQENRLPKSTTTTTTTTTAAARAAPKDAMGEPNRAGLSAKPIRRARSVKATRVATRATATDTAKSDEHEASDKVEVAILSPKKAQQNGPTLGAGSAAKQPARPQTPAKSLSQSPFEVQVPVSTSSSPRRPEPTEQPTQDAAVEKSTEHATASLSSPAKRPPPSPFKNALKLSAKRVKLADTPVFQPTTNGILKSPPKTGLMSLSPSKVSVSMSKVSVSLSPTKLSTNDRSVTAKDSLLQQPAAKLPRSPKKNLGAPEPPSKVNAGPVNASTPEKSNHGTTSPSKLGLSSILKQPAKTAVSCVTAAPKSVVFAAADDPFTDESELDLNLSPTKLLTSTPKSPSKAGSPPRRGQPSPSKPSVAADGCSSKKVTSALESAGDNASVASLEAWAQPTANIPTLSLATDGAVSPSKVTPPASESPATPSSKAAPNTSKSPRKVNFGDGKTSSRESLLIMQAAVEGLFPADSQTSTTPRSPSKDGPSLLQSIVDRSTSPVEPAATSVSPTKKGSSVMPSPSKSIISPFNLSVGAGSVSSSDQSTLSSSLSTNNTVIKPSFFDEALVTVPNTPAKFMEIDGPAGMQQSHYPSSAGLEHATPEPSEASQEYGDENVSPVRLSPEIDPALIDPVLLAMSPTPERSNRADTVTCTPARVFSGPQTHHEVHTVSKVPLKEPADDSPPITHGHQALPQHGTTSNIVPPSIKSGGLDEASPLKRKAPAVDDDDDDADDSSEEISEESDEDEPPVSSKKRRTSCMWVHEPATTPPRPTFPVPPMTAPAAAGTAQWAGTRTRALTARRRPSPHTLRGAVVFVDVHTTEGGDASGIFIELLTQMGARCVKQWHWNPDAGPRTSVGSMQATVIAAAAGAPATAQRVGITHVVFKDGSKRTLEKVRQAKGAVHCVGVAWVLDCERDDAWLEEDQYSVDITTVPRLHQRRRKSMEPRALASAGPPCFAAPYAAVNASVAAYTTGAAGMGQQTSPAIASFSASPSPPPPITPSPLYTNHSHPYSNGNAVRQVAYGHAGNEGYLIPSPTFAHVRPYSTPVPTVNRLGYSTPTPTAISNTPGYSATTPISPFSRVPPYSYSPIPSEGDTTMSTPYFLKPSAIVQRTCPPKPKLGPYRGVGTGQGSLYPKPPKRPSHKETRKTLFPVTGRIDDCPDERLRSRLEDARRKTMQFAPKVGSPLGKTVVSIDDIDDDDDDYPHRGFKFI